MALVVTPVADSEPGCSRFLAAIQRRFTPIANLCLAVLIVTGMVQLTASSNYVGFLSFSNLWAKAILLKHVAVGGMIATALYMSLVLQPDINRTAMLLAAGKATPEETRRWPAASRSWRKSTWCWRSSCCCSPPSRGRSDRSSRSLSPSSGEGEITR